MVFFLFVGRGEGLGDGGKFCCRGSVSFGLGREFCDFRMDDELVCLG